MGLKGNLAVVNLADVFQMLSRGKSTGLLRVQAPEGTRYIELQDGLISLAGRSTQYIQLGDLLLSRKSIDYAKLETALKIHKENGMVLGQVLIEMNYISKPDLENALHFLIEEEICDLFTLREGEFDFLASASLDTKIAPGGGAVRLRIEPDSLLLEAARRADEWHEIEQRITTQSLLFRLTEDGQRIYRDADSISEEGRVLMRLLQANNTVEGIVQKSCLGRLNSNRMVLELWDAQLIEPVPKDEYMRYCKLQIEAGQLPDALRIAVHASKVGSPETIKAAIPLIDNMRKQLAAEEKPTATPALEKEKEKAVAISRRPASMNNLIIKKKKLPWVAIGIGVGVLALIAGGIFWYMQQPDPHVGALRAFEKVKTDTRNSMQGRKFLDAQITSSRFSSDDADVKKLAERFKKDIETEIDTQLIQDIGDFDRKIQSGVNKDDLTELKDKLKDYEGWEPKNDRAMKAFKKMKKQLPDFEIQFRSAEFNKRLEMLQKDVANRNRTDEELIKSYKDLLKEDPPERIALTARADLYKLQAPRIETQRQLALARELAAKGGYDSARKMNESVRVKNPGTAAAIEAEANLKEIDNREMQATDAMAKARRLILQKKDKEATDALEQLMRTNPPQRVLDEALTELRKLIEEIPEAKLADRMQEAGRIAETDPKKARQIILDEIIARHPWSQAAWSALLRVKISSSPEGATVTVNGAKNDRVIGVTRDASPLLADLPAMGPVKLTFTLPGFEPYEFVENNLRGDRIEAVFIRKPQIAVLAPVAGNAGMALLGETLLLAGSNELVVLNRDNLSVLRRINLEAQPQPMKIENKTEQPPALKKGEVKLRALSVNAEEADAFAFISTADSYFFQIQSNGTDFWRIPCQPGSVGAPQMYRPAAAAAVKMIGLISTYGYELYSEKLRQLFKSTIPGAGGQEQPYGIAFDGDTFYVPRDNNTLYAIEGYRGAIKFEKRCTDRISSPPAITRDNRFLGIIDSKGRIIILNAKNDGKESARADLEANSSLGLTATNDMFVAATDDGSLFAIPVSGGKALWSVKLPSRAIYTPEIYVPKKNAKDPSPVAIVCCEQINNAYTVVALNLQSGSLIWRARLSTKPVSVAVGQDSAYISTSDGELLKFEINLPSQN